LFTMPGVPSVYAGSEWGITGTRTATDDRVLRPALDLETMQREYPSDLMEVLRRLIALRRSSEALRHGTYRQLVVAAEQLAFLRQTREEAVIVAVNAASEATMTLQLPTFNHASLVDLLNPPVRFRVTDGSARIDVPACWARVLRVERDG
jgi:cyclomaltodextrinase / maltogenic alpha-amylase / neopullulanase